MAKKSKKLEAPVVESNEVAAVEAKPAKPAKPGVFLRRADGREFPWNPRPEKRMGKMEAKGSAEVALIDGVEVTVYRTTNAAWSGAENDAKRLRRVWMRLPNGATGFIVGDYAETVALDGGFDVCEGKANRTDPKPEPSETLAAKLAERAAKFRATMDAKKGVEVTSAE
jgi:hypothetical protein